MAVKPVWMPLTSIYVLLGFPDHPEADDHLQTGNAGGHASVTTDGADAFRPETPPARWAKRQKQSIAKPPNRD